MNASAEVSWMGAWFWDVGTKCFALGCYAFPRLRPVLWFLGRCFEGHVRQVKHANYIKRC